MFIATPQATTGSYFMGFKNNQVDWIKKGLFILAFALCFMIRALDLMEGSLSSPPSSVADMEHNFAAFPSYLARY